MKIRNKTIKEMVDEIPTTFHAKGVSIIEEISLGDFEFAFKMCIATQRTRIRFKVLLHSLNCEAGVWYFNSYEQAQEFVKVYCKKNNICLGDFLYER